MSLRWSAIFTINIILLSSSLLAAPKSGARVDRIGTFEATDIRIQQSLATADTCFVSDNGEILFSISSWVTGQELYKSLMNPESNCSPAYPYTVNEINMPMYFGTATQIVVSVDLEAVDYTTIPGCPIPGPVLALSQEFTLDVPTGGGIFNIWVPLDTPFVVTEPFFAGFFIANAIDPAVDARVLTDTLPELCTTFNIWDQTVGWIDLVNNELFSFPGRLAMEVSGTPGGTGGGGDTTPITKILSPAPNEKLYKSVEIWAYDSVGASNSGAFDYVSFEYSNGGAFVEIARDYDNFSPLRNGDFPAESGSGMSYNWDFSSFPEGTYIIRATIFDTLGRSSSTSVTTYLEPTPPIAQITTPDLATNICTPLNIIMSSSDEDLSFVSVSRKNADWSYSAGLSTMSQLNVGDANGNINDGNLAANGEFGTYYSGPVAATVALQAWDSRGITGLVSGAFTQVTVAEELATLFNTRSNLGTYDYDLYSGLNQYSLLHGDKIKLDLKRNPDKYTLRYWVEEEERIVILGLSGNPGIYLTVSGFFNWQVSDSMSLVSYLNPITGTIQTTSMRSATGYSELLLNNVWHRVDLMISLLADNWFITRSTFGADFDGTNGWLVQMQNTDLKTDSLYFIRSLGSDNAGNEGYNTVLVQYNCSQVFAQGDYNSDGVADISDLFVIINFITKDGTPPVGGAERADANCDNYINITDVVYFMNYLFGGANPPCY